MDFTWDVMSTVSSSSVQLRGVKFPKEAEDSWRFPVETMCERTGDCEDTSILAAAVLRRLGHHVAIAVMPEHAALGVEAPPGIPGHFATVHGHRMYYCETTAAGFFVGELPDSVDPDSITWVSLP